LHRGQANSVVEMGKTTLILVLEGIISQAIFQRKSFSLSVIFNFHKDFQREGEKGEEVEEDLGLEMIL
jgi:hypothetical protein